MTSTTRLGLPLIDAAQAQKHVTHNEAINALDQLVQASVVTRTLATPPASPVAGDAYIVPAAPAGAWTGRSGAIAAWRDGVWTFYPPNSGWCVWVLDETRIYAWSGTAWVDAVGLLTTALQNMRLLGLGTTATTANPLSVKANATLFTALATTEGGTGDLRLALNKQAAANTLSQLYQDGYSGRAETGLCGDDNFHFKVSPDGSSWKDALIIDRTTAALSFYNPAATRANLGLATAIRSTNVIAFTSSGTYTPSAGVVFADVLVVGSGAGGGGAAATGAGQGSAAAGGSSGAAARSILTAAQIGASQTVTVGLGGTGGLGATPSNGSNGNPSSFGTLVAANGGYGGQAGGPTSSLLTTDAGGPQVATAGQLRFSSNGAGPGVIFGSATGYGGFGAPSILGGSARASATWGRSNTGTNGAAPGAGGAGACCGASSAAANGGNGADGLVIVIEYIGG